MKLVNETLLSMPVKRPQPCPYHRQHLCLDKGYDYDEVRQLAQAFGYTTHIKSRGEQAKELKRALRRKARRWVVERTHSWLNRFRRLLIRREKKCENYIAMLHRTFALIAYRAAGLLG